MKNKSTLYLTQGAMIAAVYVVLTMIFAPISFGDVQIRFAEALTIMPFFTPAAVPGLFVGCLLGNIAVGGIPADVAYGSMATLLGAIGTYAIRKQNRFLAPLPPIIANTLIVPFVLRYGYGINLPIPLMMLTVAMGEVVSAGVFGIILQTILMKNENVLFRWNRA